MKSNSIKKQTNIILKNKQTNSIQKQKNIIVKNQPNKQTNKQNKHDTVGSLKVGGLNSEPVAC